MRLVPPVWPVFNNSSSKTTTHLRSLLYRTGFSVYKSTNINVILTLFGTISVDRSIYYHEKNGDDYLLFPLDNVLGLENKDFTSLDTLEMILLT